MNCKQGDLAIVVRAKNGQTEHLGKLVEVLYAAPLTNHSLPDGFPHKASDPGYWIVKFQSKIRVPVASHHRMAQYASVSDRALRPIRDNDGTDETLSDEWAGKPKKTPITVTSDEEAARIAETTPGSHIHVVSRSGNVLSEYWGKPF